MRALPLGIGTMHFVGIGGIGMSGIAEVLHNLGYAVQGSDISDSANVRRLRESGIPVAVGHDAANLGSAQVVVTSTAVKRDNPEVVAARAKLIPVVRRAEMLAELMRLRWSIAVGGTHGKTTTTSMVASVLEAAHLDPTVINGGIINAYGTNTRLGAGDWMVVEADESDGSFLRLPSTIAVVTNMDPEHLDHWGSPEAMTAGYDQFVGNIPFYGFAVLCIDHPAVQQMIPRLDRRIITYGFSQQADVRAERVMSDRMGATFEVMVTDRARNRSRRMGPFRLPMLGQHNVSNSLAAIAIGVEMEIEEATLKSAILGFKGVKRRFTKTGESGGITVIDDYGHHPGGDHGRAEGGPPSRRARSDRRGAAAPLQPAAVAVSGVLHVHERCEHGDRGRRVRRRRDANRGGDAGRAGGWPAHERPPERSAVAGTRASGGDDPRDRAHRRHGGVFGCGKHHCLGGGAAGAVGGAAGLEHEAVGMSARQAGGAAP